jgi:hypothetical protein
MQKRNRNRKMKGGFWDSLKNSISSGINSLSQGATNAWNTTKKASEQAYDSAKSSLSNTPSYSSSSSSSSSYMSSPSASSYSAPSMGQYQGGQRKRSRKMRGGYKDNISLTGLASSAAPVAGISTAKPHNWVGGKTRRHKTHRRKHANSRRHRK